MLIMAIQEGEKMKDNDINNILDHIIKSLNEILIDRNLKKDNTRPKKDYK